jgi:hypothetical protein
MVIFLFLDGRVYPGGFSVIWTLSIILLTWLSSVTSVSGVTPVFVAHWALDSWNSYFLSLIDKWYNLYLSAITWTILLSLEFYSLKLQLKSKFSMIEKIFFSNFFLF